MADEPTTRSVKIGEDERTGWSSERPRRDGGPQRPPNIAVRCKVLTPSDHVRYSPGSMLVIVCPSPAERDRFTERMIPNKPSLLSLGKVRSLLAGRVSEEDVESRASEVLDAAITKRLQANETVVVATEGTGAEERERFARMAAAAKRPRHLILLEVARADVAEDDRACPERAAPPHRGRRAWRRGLPDRDAPRRAVRLRAEADRLRVPAARRLAPSAAARRPSPSRPRHTSARCPRARP